jgi:hypothetical protein
MKKLVLAICVVLLWSCNQKAEMQEPKPIESKSVAPKPVGSDLDSHGCKASAGYTWSTLRNECVRIFEAGTRLDPVEPNGMSAFVMLDEKQLKAEVFTLLEKQPIMLNQQKPGIYTQGDWELQTGTKWVLNYKGKRAFNQP